MDPKSQGGASPEAESPESEELTTARVAEYLRQHPDFLADQDELVAVLTPPVQHQNGPNVVDMRHFAMRRMQEEIGRLKQQQQALIQTSRANLASQARVHAAVLAIIGARSFEHLMQTVVTDLAVMLDLDVVTLCIESEAVGAISSPLAGLQLLDVDTVDALIGPKKDCLLIDHSTGASAIFGGGAGLVQSQALLRISVSAEAPSGLLALGSRSPTRFRPKQGVELLNFLARALEITLGKWLHL
ncbi:MAG TPA: DUF484 family protein [Stellaceae bacterium]|nr:DUF484 family protein [Stellaceae bacterium]